MDLSAISETIDGWIQSLGDQLASLSSLNLTDPKVMQQFQKTLLDWSAAGQLPAVVNKKCFDVVMSYIHGMQ